MAAAYRSIDRIHSPMTTPLEDLSPQHAHLKVGWASTSNHLGWYIDLQHTDFSHLIRNTKLTADSLMYLNVYKTDSVTETAFGFGPNPQTPIFLVYPVPHPHDRIISDQLFRKVAPVQEGEKRSLFSKLLGKAPTTTPFRITQVMFDIKHPVTQSQETLFSASVFREFLEYRRFASVGDPVPQLGRTAMRVYKDPKPVPEALWKAQNITGYKKKSNGTVPVTITLQEAMGINDSSVTPVYYQVSGTNKCRGFEETHPNGSCHCKKEYLWTAEDASWRLIFEGEFEAAREVNPFQDPDAYDVVLASKADKVIMAKLFMGSEEEPSAVVDLLAGQMQFLETMLLETLELTIMILCTLVNVEVAIRREAAEDLKQNYK